MFHVSTELDDDDDGHGVKQAVSDCEEVSLSHWKKQEPSSSSRSSNSRHHHGRKDPLDGDARQSGGGDRDGRG